MDEEGLTILNTGEPTHVSFSTGTETAIDLTIVSPELTLDMEWYVNADLFSSDHYPTITRVIQTNPRATKRPA
jgi:hypothetical protein